MRAENKGGKYINRSLCTQCLIPPHQPSELLMLPSHSAARGILLEHKSQHTHPSSAQSPPSSLRGKPEGGIRVYQLHTTWPDHPCGLLPFLMCNSSGSSDTLGRLLPQGLCTCYSPAWNTLSPDVQVSVWLAPHLLGVSVQHPPPHCAPPTRLSHHSPISVSVFLSSICYPRIYHMSICLLVYCLCLPLLGCQVHGGCLVSCRAPKCPEQCLAHSESVSNTSGISA